MGRSFWLLWSAQAVSALGDAFGAMAMGWAVYELTGSKVAMGSLFLVNFLPQMVIWIFGGPLVDRFERRRLMIWLDLARAAAYALPPLLAVTGHLALWHLFALTFVEGVAGALFWPASLALLPSLVASEKLVRANSLTIGAFTSVNLIGPAIAGLLVAAYGSQPAMLIDAASFALSALTLFWLPSMVRRAAAAGEGPDAPYLMQLAEGYKFFGRAPALLIMMLLLAASNMGTTVMWTMLIPWVREVIGAGAGVVGMWEAAVALGMLAATVIIGRMGDIKRRRVTMLLGLAGGGLFEAAMGFVGRGQVALAVGLAALWGFASPFWDTQSQAIYQRVVPDRLRGRVMSVRLLVGQGMRPVGALLGSFMADRAGLPLTFLVFGIVPGLLALAGCFLPLLGWVDGDLREVPDRVA